MHGYGQELIRNLRAKDSYPPEADGSSSLLLGTSPAFAGLFVPQNFPNREFETYKKSDKTSFNR